MQSLLKLFLLPQALTKTLKVGEEEEIEIGDLEEQGYQASFSKLGAAEKVKTDVVGFIEEPRVYLAASLVATSAAHPGLVSFARNSRLEKRKLMSCV